MSPPPAEHAKELVEFAHGLDASMFPTGSRRLLGEIALAEGRAADAADEATSVAEGLRERPAPLEAWRILSLLGRARRALGDHDQARAAFREAQKVVTSLAANIHDDALRAGFLDSPAAREIAAEASRPD